MALGNYGNGSEAQKHILTKISTGVYMACWDTRYKNEGGCFPLFFWLLVTNIILAFNTIYSQTWANDHLSTTTTLIPAQAILVLKLPLNNDHLSTTTNGQLNPTKIETLNCLHRPHLAILNIFWWKFRFIKPTMKENLIKSRLVITIYSNAFVIPTTSVF